MFAVNILCMECASIDSKVIKLNRGFSLFNMDRKPVKIVVSFTSEIPLLKIFSSIIFAGQCRTKLGKQPKSKYNVRQK